MFGIIHKNTKQFFGGFDNKGAQVWVDCVSDAWKTANKDVATCQASALVMCGVNAQRKAVAL